MLLTQRFDRLHTGKAGLLSCLCLATAALADGPAVPGLQTGQGTLPTPEQSLILHHTLDAFADNMMSGGPPPDGIPSIDDPQFLPASANSLDPNDKVIGLAYNGVVRAYPHNIMVLHEIVNHEIGGENIAVTYCPLTERTGFARNYRRDPYGGYNPTGGYYSSERVMFPLMSEDDSLHPKHMVSGARTEDHAVVFDLALLAEEGLIMTEHFVGVHDEDLGNAHIYRRTGDHSFIWQDGAVHDSDAGEHFAADDLPLEPVTTIEAFWFAWNAVYPDSERGW